MLRDVWQCIDLNQEELFLRRMVGQGGHYGGHRSDDNETREEDISWEEFEKTLKKRKLAVYKAENSDFLKIMRGGRTLGRLTWMGRYTEQGDGLVG